MLHIRIQIKSISSIINAKKRKWKFENILIANKRRLLWEDHLILKFSFKIMNKHEIKYIYLQMNCLNNFMGIYFIFFQIFNFSLICFEMEFIYSFSNQVIFLNQFIVGKTSHVCKFLSTIFDSFVIIKLYFQMMRNAVWNLKMMLSKLKSSKNILDIHSILTLWVI